MMKLTTLDSGLRVASRTMPGFETVAVGLYADAGSRHEPARVNGIAHLFEHMVFKGAGTRSAREISEAIEDVGGDLNASTDREGTSFTASLLAEHLPLGIEIIADMIQRPHFPGDDLAREKEVVLQELGEARDTPNDIIFDDLWMAAFPTSRWAAPCSATRRASRRSGSTTSTPGGRGQYRTGNLYLGRRRQGRSRRAGRARRARISAVSAAGTLAAAEPARFAGTAHARRPRADQAHLTGAYAAPTIGAADYHAARLFADVVGSGASSRLFQAVREDRGLAYSVWAQLHPYRDCALFYFYAATAPREAAAAARLIGEVIAEAAADTSERELQRAKAQAKAGLLMSLETAWGQANYVARQLSLYGRLREPDARCARSRR